MKRFIVLISIFAIALMFCGAVSATSYSVSNNGKIISVKNSYGTSTLKDQVSLSKKTGPYGYGYYGVVKTTGKDIKGTSIIKTAVYFNKNNNPFYGKYLKYMTTKTSNSDGSSSNNMIKVTSNYQATTTTNGKTFNGLTYSGIGIYSFYYKNGQRLIKNVSMTLKFNKNSTRYANVTITNIPVYKYINRSYQIMKEVVTTKTSYTNGDTRKSIVSTAYSRNSKGVLIGQKTYGTSSGTEIINGKTVTYTGKITIGTKYDPKDSWHEYYVTGDYLEIRTSTATNLKRTLPIEAL